MPELGAPGVDGERSERSNTDFEAKLSALRQDASEKLWRSIFHLTAATGFGSAALFNGTEVLRRTSEQQSAKPEELALIALTTVISAFNLAKGFDAASESVRARQQIREMVRSTVEKVLPKNMDVKG
jgi:putative protein kinase ArgK-like GTPase of G3E family